jgi:hypothetical protein
MSIDVFRSLAHVARYLPSPWVRLAKARMSGFALWKLQGKAISELPRIETSLQNRIRIKYTARLLPAKRVLCLPQFPPAKHSVLVNSLLNGYAVTNNPASRWDIVFYYRDATYRDGLSMDGVHVVNGRSVDISKQNVERMFSQEMGYDLAIDPLSWCGTIVVKSNLNGKHDGKLVNGPLQPENIDAGSVYERLIRNHDENDNLIEYRTIVMGAEVPLVYVKRRRPENRFLSAAALIERQDRDVTFDKSENVFSEAEIRSILALARALHLDFGEMDILRDSVDGRIYVVDVNNTPISPPRNMVDKIRQSVLPVAAEAFKCFVVQWIEEGPVTR